MKPLVTGQIFNIAVMPNGDGKFSQCDEKSGVVRVRVRCSIPSRKKTFSFFGCSYLLWRSNSLLLKGYRITVPEGAVAGEMNMATVIHLFPRLRKYGAIPLLPPPTYGFMTCREQI